SLKRGTFTYTRPTRYDRLPPPRPPAVPKHHPPRRAEPDGQPGGVERDPGELRGERVVADAVEVVELDEIDADAAAYLAQREVCAVRPPVVPLGEFCVRRDGLVPGQVRDAVEGPNPMCSPVLPPPCLGLLEAVVDVEEDGDGVAARVEEPGRVVDQRPRAASGHRIELVRNEADVAHDRRRSRRARRRPSAPARSRPPTISRSSIRTAVTDG